MLRENPENSRGSFRESWKTLLESITRVVVVYAMLRGNWKTKSRLIFRWYTRRSCDVITYITNFSLYVELSTLKNLTIKIPGPLRHSLACWILRTFERGRLLLLSSPLRKISLDWRRENENIVCTMKRMKRLDSNVWMVQGFSRRAFLVRFFSLLLRRLTHFPFSRT